MTDKQPEALEVAGRLTHGIRDTKTCDRAAALLRIQHKQIAAYKLLTESQEAQLSLHRERADKFREAIATLQSEREANAILTAAIERKDALLRQALTYLEESRTLEPINLDWVKGARRAVAAAITKELSQ